MNKKTAINTVLVIWFLGILIVTLLILGCATTKEQPMYDNLLFKKGYKNLAYKSITIKDIIVKEECGS